MTLAVAEARNSSSHPNIINSFLIQINMRVRAYSFVYCSLNRLTLSFDIELHFIFILHLMMNNNNNNNGAVLAVLCLQFN